MCVCVCFREVSSLWCMTQSPVWELKCPAVQVHASQRESVSQKRLKVSYPDTSAIALKNRRSFHSMQSIEQFGFCIGPCPRLNKNNKLYLFFGEYTGDDGENAGDEGEYATFGDEGE